MVGDPWLASLSTSWTGEVKLMIWADACCENAVPKSTVAMKSWPIFARCLRDRRRRGDINFSLHILFGFARVTDREVTFRSRDFRGQMRLRTSVKTRQFA